MSTNMEVISTFNAFNLKNIISIKDMVLSKLYLIDGAYRTTTKFGKSIVFQLDAGLLYLPKRFNTLEDHFLDKISDGAFTISKIPLNEDKNDSAYRLELSEVLNTDIYFSSY